VIEAIAWKYRTGSPWRDLPAEFGSWKGNSNAVASLPITAPAAHVAG
jgi:transposase